MMEGKAAYTINPYELASVAVACCGAMQKVPEFAALLDLVASGSPKRILEIGFGKGGTSWAWSKLQSVEQLIIVNLPNGPWGGENDTQALDNIVSNADGKKVDYIAGNSQNSETLEAVEARLAGEKVDFLMIDGDHSRVGVMADYDLYKKFVRKGGLVALHDIREHPPETQCEVKLFWDGLKATLNKDDYCEFIADDEHPWGGLGVIKV